MNKLFSAVIFRYFIVLVILEVVVGISLYDFKADWRLITSAVLREANFNMGITPYGVNKPTSTRVVVVVGTNYINIGGVSEEQYAAKSIITGLQQILNQSGFSDTVMNTAQNYKYIVFGTRIGHCGFGKTKSGITVPIGAIVNTVKRYSKSSTILLYAPKYALDTLPGNPIMNMEDSMAFNLDNTSPNATLTTKTINLQMYVVLLFVALIIGFALPIMGFSKMLMPSNASPFEQTQDMAGVRTGSIMMICGGLLIGLVCVLFATNPIGKVLIDTWFGNQFRVVAATDAMVKMLALPAVYFFFYGMQFYFYYLSGKSPSFGTSTGFKGQ